MKKISIRSPARLHLGLIDPSGVSGRRFGSIGVAIDEPAVRIQAERSNGIVVSKSKRVEVSTIEVENFAKRVLGRCGIKGGIKIEVETDIPKHVGLGSTTQIALSVGTAATKLYGIESSPRDLAGLLGLGKISGIGTAAFEAGGFIVDCGIGKKQGVPPVLARLDFPEDWRFVVVTPSERRGLDEREEKRVLRGISVPPGRVSSICKLLFMKMIPAVVEREIESFGKALTEIQILVGKSFARYQHGLFYSRLGERLTKFLLKKGARGIGQSSWGSTVYGIVEGEGEGKKLEGEVKRFMVERGVRGNVYCVAANNVGASITER